ncbi:MAG: zinc ribbon domain-containing protein [Candidatus Nitrosotenuis sp.]
MNKFESELKKGRFLVGHCPNCDKIIWPPSDFCSMCFGELSWRHLNEHGTLIEHSAKDGKQFCIAEFEGRIRVMGMISGTPVLKPGQKIRLVSCGFEDAPKFIFEAE